MKSPRYSSKILFLLLKQKIHLRHYNEEENPGDYKTKIYRKIAKDVRRGHFIKKDTF